jgi:carbonic anhydrase/acetyltransferase-like protein (isoleucine patch superfamily)
MIKPFGGVAPQIDESAFIAETAVVIGDVHIGAESSVWYGAVIRGDCFYVRIGRRANIQDNSVIHVSNGAHATILEDDVTVGHSATLHGCYVERGALIGIGAIVLDGARIGAYSLVAAGALVTPGTQIPPRSLVMGSPAKVRRQLTDTECADLDTFWQNYVGYVKQYKAEGFGDKN